MERQDKHLFYAIISVNNDAEVIAKKRERLARLRTKIGVFRLAFARPNVRFAYITGLSDGSSNRHSPSEFENTLLDPIAFRWYQRGYRQGMKEINAKCDDTSD